MYIVKKYNHRYGFFGLLINQPPCPKCEYKVDTVELLKAQKEQDEIEAQFFNKELGEDYGS